MSEKDSKADDAVDQDYDAFSESSTLGGGFTALHYASYHGNSKMIDLLVSAGADIYAVNE